MEFQREAIIHFHCGRHRNCKHKHNHPKQFVSNEYSCVHFLRMSQLQSHQSQIIAWRRRTQLQNGAGKRKTNNVKQSVPGPATLSILGARQRSGEGVVRRNGCPKGCLWRVRFFFCPLKVCSLNTLRGPENRRGAEKKRTLQRHPFGQPFLRTTPSPLLWRALKFIQLMGPTHGSGLAWTPS